MTTVSIFLPYFIAFFLLFAGRDFEDYFLTMASGILFFIMGVVVIINGYADFDNLTNLAIASINWGTGLYIIYRSIMEIMKNG